MPSSEDLSRTRREAAEFVGKCHALESGKTHVATFAGESAGFAPPSTAI